MRAVHVIALGAWLGGFVFGCSSDGPELTDVTGKITLDGQPVAGCQVTFVPDGGGSPSYAQTDAKGEYRLMFTRNKYGAMLGRHNVSLETRKLSAAEKEELRAAGEEVPADSVSIPKKYREDGALTAEVKSGKNKIDFELTSD